MGPKIELIIRLGIVKHFTVRPKKWKKKSNPLNLFIHRPHFYYYKQSCNLLSFQAIIYMYISFIFCFMLLKTLKQNSVIAFRT